MIPGMSASTMSRSCDVTCEVGYLCREWIALSWVGIREVIEKEDFARRWGSPRSYVRNELQLDAELGGYGRLPGL